MIFGLSYPKSGTCLRTLIGSYYYSEDGLYKEVNIKKLVNFLKKYFTTFNYNKNIPSDTSRFWIEAQQKINEDKKKDF